MTEHEPLTEAELAALRAYAGWDGTEDVDIDGMTGEDADELTLRLLADHARLTAELAERDVERARSGRTVSALEVIQVLEYSAEARAQLAKVTAERDHAIKVATNREWLGEAADNARGQLAEARREAEERTKEWFGMQARARECGADLTTIRAVLDDYAAEEISASKAVELLRDLCAATASAMCQVPRGRLPNPSAPAGEETDHD
jgi:hypothetical protein